MKRSEVWGLVCLGMLYILWGSTYLGIRLADESIPPLIVGSIRYTFGGLTLLLFLLPTALRTMKSRELRNALLVGAVTAGISNGALICSEVAVPSSYAAIAFTTMPLFLMILNMLIFDKVIPSRLHLAAIPLGLAGIALVVGTGETLSGGKIGTFYLALLIIAPSFWALGTLLGRKLTLPKNMFLSSSCQMLGGALFFIILSLLHDDWTHFIVAAVTSRSLGGLIYLAVGGSLLGFTCFAITVQTLEPQLIGTYAFAAPIVALILGYIFGERVLRTPILIGSALAISSVFLTFYATSRDRKKKANLKVAPT